MRSDHPHALAAPLAGHIRESERRFSDATGDWLRPPSATSVATHANFATTEAMALAALRLSDSEASGAAVAALRITEDLRQIDDLTDKLAKRPATSTLPEELLGHLDRMRELTALQLAAAAECVERGDEALAVNTARTEAELDGWYDLLLHDVVEDLQDDGGPRDVVMPLLAIARTLERVGDHALHVVQCAASLATPAPATTSA